jgi:cell division protein FtsB
MQLQEPDIEQSERPMRRPGGVNGTQIMFAVIVAIGLMLAINFSSRVSADRELRAVRDAVQQEIDQLKREQGQLIDQLNYVQSDAFIETWARSEGRMVREGEVLMVLFPANTTASAAPTPEPLPVLPPDVSQPTPTWQLWWAMFFDSPPPQF